MRRLAILMFIAGLVTDSAQSMDVLQKWEQPFRELMDQIYYPGYAQQLIRENPMEYARQYFYFIKLYD